MTQSFDTVVVGGGLAGWSTAYPLLKAGRHVCVIDAEKEGYATQAGAGIIAPGAGFKSPEAIFPLSQAAVRYYPQLVASIADDDGGDTGYATVDGLYVARNDQEAADLPRALDAMTARRDAGLGNIGDLTLLSGAEAKSLFPPLAEIPGAIHMTDASRVNGRLLLAALKQASSRYAITTLDATATLGLDGARATVHAEGEIVRGENVVLASGAWSTGLADALHLDLPIYPQRGQIMHIDMPDIDTSAWPIITGDYSHYILTFGPNRVVCGATREHDSGFEVRVTAGGVAEVLDEAFRVAPGLATGTVAEIRVGLRPFCPDQLPVLGCAPDIENLYLCTGHGPSGLQHAPYSGAAIANLILGQPPEINLTPYSASRFA